MNVNDKGMTLVEIIVVLVIMSVLIGTVGYGVGWISGKPAEKCAQRISYSLQHCRTLSTGKKSVTYELTGNADGEILLVETIEGTASTSVVGERGVVVEYTLDGTAYTAVSDSSSLVLAFDRSSGSFLPANGGSAYCTDIRVSKGTTVRNIELVPLTGKVIVR